MKKKETIDTGEFYRDYNTGIPIIIMPVREYQNRKHKKKRINKKWRKRYGVTGYSLIEDGEVISYNGQLTMNKKTYDRLKGEGLCTILQEYKERLQWDGQNPNQY